MTGFDDTSDNRELLDDPTFQAQLDQACKSAFKTAVKKYGHPPYDSWEDLETDVVLKILTSQAFFIQYRELTNEKGYLYRIALNVLISKYRRDHLDRTESAVQDLEGLRWASTSNNVEREILRNELRELLNEIWPLLKPKEREVVEWYLDDRHFADMAREQKVVRATISKRFANAIKKIQQLVRARDLGRKT